MSQLSQRSKAQGPCATDLRFGQACATTPPAEIWHRDSCADSMAERRPHVGISPGILGGALEPRQIHDPGADAIASWRDQSRCCYPRAAGSRELRQPPIQDLHSSPGTSNLLCCCPMGLSALGAAGVQPHQEFFQHFTSSSLASCDGRWEVLVHSLIDASSGWRPVGSSSDDLRLRDFVLHRTTGRIPTEAKEKLS